VSTANSEAPFLPDRLLEVLREFPRPRSYLVALSGGLDSVVLLHAMARLREALGIPLRAVHIDHGIHADSAHWSEHCRQICHSLGIALEERQLKVTPVPRQSLEARARKARYDAIAEVLEAREMLLLAQHGDDQVETFLLQLLRGAGVEGLSAMPGLRSWRGGWMARPLLGFSREQLRQWAVAQKLAWVEDPSNEDRRIARNFLRHEIVPRLRQRWPALVTTISRSAAHCAEAAGVLREIAVEDLEAARGTTSWQLTTETLQRLSPARQRNLLRAWIRAREVPVPDSRTLESLLLEVIPARTDARPEILWKGGAVRRYRQQLYLFPKPLPTVPSDTVLHWQGEKPLTLPEGLGQLAFAGKKPDWFPREGTEVVFDKRGVRCTIAGRQGAKSFKQLCQELGIPPWLRPLLPLVKVGESVAAVADYALCEPFEGKPGLRWERPEWLG